VLENILSCNDPGEAQRSQTMDRSFTLEIKICGLTRAEDALAALEAGADYLGFVFYPRSPRAVTPGTARKIIDSIGASCKAVGVFVNETPEFVERTARECQLAAVQLHGDERCCEYGGLSVPLWRAVWFRGGTWVPDPQSWRAERYVADAAAPGIYGGGGRAGCWKEAACLASGRKVMLAGGLTPENVADAIEAVRPAGVDVVSGVEAAPGRKDRAKLFAFVKAARVAAEKLREEMLLGRDQS